MTTRPEAPVDALPIAGIVARAFANHPHSSGTEVAIVRELRAAHALSVSLVGEIDGHVRGYIAASPVLIAGKPSNWFGLGPIAVEPTHQRQGLGVRLVVDCLDALRRLSAAGCVVAGAHSYYSRFGFRHEAGLVYPGLPAEYFMALPFGDSVPLGEVSYHPAFDSEA